MNSLYSQECNPKCKNKVKHKVKEREKLSNEREQVGKGAKV